jgi:hypothetical protein
MLASSFLLVLPHCITSMKVRTGMLATTAIFVAQQCMGSPIPSRINANESHRALNHDAQEYVDSPRPSIRWMQRQAKNRAAAIRAAQEEARRERQEATHTYAVYEDPAHANPIASPLRQSQILDHRTLPFLNEEERRQAYGGHTGHFETEGHREMEMNRQYNSLRQTKFFTLMTEKQKLAYMQRYYPRIQQEQERIQRDIDEMHNQFLAAPQDNKADPRIESITQEMRQFLLEQRRTNGLLVPGGVSPRLRSRSKNNDGEDCSSNRQRQRHKREQGE